VASTEFRKRLPSADSSIPAQTQRSQSGEEIIIYIQLLKRVSGKAGKRGSGIARNWVAEKRGSGEAGSILSYDWMG